MNLYEKNQAQLNIFNLWYIFSISKLNNSEDFLNHYIYTIIGHSPYLHIHRIDLYFNQITLISQQSTGQTILFLIFSHFMVNNILNNLLLGLYRKFMPDYSKYNSWVSIILFQSLKSSYMNFSFEESLLQLKFTLRFDLYESMWHNSPGYPCHIRYIPL